MAKKYPTYNHWIHNSSSLELCDRLAILSHITGLSTNYILFNSNSELSDDEYLELISIESTLQGNYPLAYILGKQPFYDLMFTVNSKCLIPRACTETIVKYVLQHTHPRESLSILDLGTGSGCIALTLAKHLPNSIVCGSDISSKALEVAEHNRIRLGIRNCSFVQSNWFDQLSDTYDILISNPPYVCIDDQRDLSTLYEPGLALFSQSGTKDLNTIIREGINYVNQYIILEHASWQADYVHLTMLEQGYINPTHLYNDINHHLRATTSYAPSNR
jgi:release factor glutamine methyltransferase